jgi:hypothetical protein
VQGQDWDFLAHTFWLKHGVALLFDSLFLAEGITLAYNSGWYVCMLHCTNMNFVVASLKRPFSCLQPTCRLCLA